MNKENFNPLKGDWIRIAIYSGSIASAFFASYYISQGSRFLSVLHLYLFSLVTLIIALFLKRSMGKWEHMKHIVAIAIWLSAAFNYLTNTDSPEQIVWFATYPIFLFIISGFSAGWKYTGSLMLVYILGYKFPFILGHEPDIPGSTILHTVVSFFLTATLTGFYQYKGEKYQKVLEQSAFYDNLTGAMTREWMYERILEEIHILERKWSGRNTTTNNLVPPFSIVLFDLDHFKKINDNFGHNAGDLVLKEIVKTVVNTIRSSDHIARWGGEEFIVFFRETTIEMAHKITENIRNAIENVQITHYHQIIKCSASFGLVEYQKNHSATSLIRYADEAMYEAKNRGRNRIVLAKSTVKKQNK